ncbi:hypothetical protein [Microtetraspora sp. NBRC 13810]|uniref:hypothetical protein n=1 Tax=Microtetraspora sp. NBRC 13810 TaxID=3030990 RepID=UPI002555A485|nr:hypothetical protein [Microtetraspora sp. NBRC 13810]
MSIDEARNAMVLWGSPEEMFAAPGEAPRLRVRDEDLTRDIFAHIGDEGRVSAIEVWRPVPSKHQSEAVHVLYGAVDMFALPASDIIHFLRDQGVEVDESDPFYPSCPQLTLGFNREGGDDIEGESGVARFFESVLVARPGYYE